jgi:hypothetical protein
MFFLKKSFKLTLTKLEDLVNGKNGIVS